MEGHPGLLLWNKELGDFGRHCVSWGLPQCGLLEEAVLATFALHVPLWGGGSWTWSYLERSLGSTSKDMCNTEFYDASCWVKTGSEKCKLNGCSFCEGEDPSFTLHTFITLPSQPNGLNSSGMTTVVLFFTFPWVPRQGLKSNPSFSSRFSHLSSLDIQRWHFWVQAISHWSQ